MSCLFGRKRGVWQGGFALLAVVCITAGLLGCENKPSGSSVPLGGFAGPSRPAEEDSQKVGNGVKLLMDSIDKPQTSIHFSYQAQENLNLKFPSQAGSQPVVGTAQVEADITPGDIDVIETRGGKKTETKAAKSDPMFGLAKLPVLGAMLEVTFPLAFSGPSAQSAGSDTVGGVAADKFNVDTTTANATTQAGMEVAAAMLGGKIKIKSVKGAVWLDKSTGRLVKFNLDSELSTQDGQSWQEHHEVVVTPK
jgi:hypothetical protein